MKYFFVIAFIAMMLSSCKKEVVENTADAVQYSYFPLKEGNWVIYQVDSIAHLTNDDGTNQPDTSKRYFQFKVREVIESSFIDGQGNTAFHIARYRQTNDTLPWDFESRWVALLNSNSAQRVEENIRYIKLSFPVNLFATWNGNAYNNFSEEEYSYTDIHAPMSISSYQFDSTVTVLQADDLNFLYKIFKEEKYANRVGMIFKQKDSLNFNAFQQVTNGYEYKETLLSYGN